MRKDFSIKRVSFNFMDTCNMDCPYCYVPFTKEKVDFNLSYKVIEKFAELGVQYITFGGGDPFIYKKFRELIKFSKSLGINVQIHTNAIALTFLDYDLIAETTQLLSLPLDGSTMQIHNLMRNARTNHYSVILKHLNELQKLPISLRIHTVVAKLNIDDIVNIGSLLNSYNFEKWVLYQYWPLHDLNDNHDLYEIDEPSFFKATDFISKTSYSFTTDVSPIVKRSTHTRYLFTSPNGHLYTHDLSNKNNYITLGTIFDDSWILAWQARLLAAKSNVSKQ